MATAWAMAESWARRALAPAPLNKTVRPSFFMILPNQSVVVEEQSHYSSGGARLHLQAAANGAGQVGGVAVDDGDGLDDGELDEDGALARARLLGGAVEP